MHDTSNSSDRGPEEYFLFALAFIGFVLTATGIIVSSPGAAFMGAALTLLALGCFLLGSSAED